MPTMTFIAYNTLSLPVMQSFHWYLSKYFMLLQRILMIDEIYCDGPLAWEWKSNTTIAVTEHHIIAMAFYIMAWPGICVGCFKFCCRLVFFRVLFFSVDRLEPRAATKQTKWKPQIMVEQKRQMNSCSPLFSISPYNSKSKLTLAKCLLFHLIKCMRSVKNDVFA